VTKQACLALNLVVFRSPICDLATQGLQIVSDLFTKVSATDLLTEAGGAITTIPGGLHRPRDLHDHHASLRCDEARSNHRDVRGLHIPWLRREPLDFAIFER
jgi:hypothetical protein